MVKNPTEEQKKILNHNGNIVVTANPGSGKTFVLVEKIIQSLQSLPEFQGVIAISFTKKASHEIKTRCKRRGVDLKKSYLGTIDGFYLSEIIYPFANRLTFSTPEYKILDSFDRDVKYKNLKNISEEFDQSQESLLLESLKEGKIFLDIIDATALYILKKVPSVQNYIKARYKHIFIDEYQDCGKIQHEIFLSLIDYGLKGMVVGDSNQSIYGFSKKSSKYLESLVKHNDFENFQMNHNHRSHLSISQYATSVLESSEISQNPLETKRVFLVKILGDEEKIANKIDENLISIEKEYGIKNHNQVAILCKNRITQDLLDKYLKTPHKAIKESPLDKISSESGHFFSQLLYACFDTNISSVDYTERFFKKDFDPTKYYQCLNRCEKIFSCSKWPYKLASFQEEMIFLADLIIPNKRDTKTLDELKRVLNNPQLLDAYIPASENQVNLLTLHKSKGLEFDIVFHLDLYEGVIPHYKGKYDQELNLHYVGITRAIQACYFLIGTRYHSTFEAQPSPFLSISGLKEKRSEIEWK